jgi:ribose-phosphate pyrophosphokinase
MDRVVTVDPHLHRVAALAEAVPARETVTLSAAAQMGGFLGGRPGSPVLLGPDEESAQWVSVVAAVAGLRFGVARKRRRGDRSVRIELPDLSFAGADVVLVDDMAATGRTLCAAAREVLAAGASSVNVLVTHPLFVGNAEADLHSAGVDAVWSTDSITHPSNVIFLDGILADALRGKAGVLAD